MAGSAIIIGGGMAGLSTGCYLQMNGYSTEIFEAADKVGGLCTCWDRKGYTIEGCLHGLVGSSPANPFYHLWNELIDMSKLSFITHDETFVFNFEDGSQFYLYSNLGKLEEYMKGIGPEDSTVIEEFISGIRRMQQISIPLGKPRELYNLLDYLKMARYLPLIIFMKKWQNTSTKDFAERFNNPTLRRAMSFILSPVLFQLLVSSTMDLKASGYPTCGSLEFVKLFERRYLSLGGRISSNSRVHGILVDENKAVGVELEKGGCKRADIIISAADGRNTIYNMLGGKYMDKRLTELYENMELQPSRIQVSLGINKTFNNIAYSTKYILDQPITIADGTSYEYIDVLTYSNIPDITPAGKMLMSIQLETREDKFWTKLRHDNKQEYLKEKTKLSHQLITVLDKRIDGIKRHIEMVDITTPATYKRYTGNWRGSTQGWANENIFKSNPFKKELPGLSNFYMVGQWVEPGGGVPTAFKSGRDLAYIICKRDKKSFISTTS